MLRDKNLIPLSHQHQHALALCVRLDRAVQAGEVELEPWQAEIQQIYEQEISVHFVAEEKELFPAARSFADLKSLADELEAEHVILRDFFDRAAARTMAESDLQQFAQLLSTHIRKEERQLFERMQQVMKPEELAFIGRALEKELETASDSCILPNASTRLRPRAK